mmetsp:Transcript_67951/g.210079  ORF Transcript_67951/g.210079 Transcript_67951/m.210079 type:complete len:107 (+) Transcript_67951:1293-1613(+)
MDERRDAAKPTAAKHRAAAPVDCQPAAPVPPGSAVSTYRGDVAAVVCGTREPRCLCRPGTVNESGPTTAPQAPSTATADALCFDGAIGVRVGEKRRRIPSERRLES